MLSLNFAGSAAKVLGQLSQQKAIRLPSKSRNFVASIGLPDTGHTVFTAMTAAVAGALAGLVAAGADAGAAAATAAARFSLSLNFAGSALNALGQLSQQKATRLPSNSTNFVGSIGLPE